MYPQRTHTLVIIYFADERVTCLSQQVLLVLVLSEVADLFRSDERDDEPVAECAEVRRRAVRVAARRRAERRRGVDVHLQVGALAQHAAELALKVVLQGHHRTHTGQMTLHWRSTQLSSR